MSNARNAINYEDKEQLTQGKLPNDLVAAIQNIYSPAGFKVTTVPQREGDPKGLEYSACWFALNHHKIAFRVAKTTQDRPGQFVTIWKRSTVSGNIVPLDISDQVSFVIVSVRGKSRNGKIYQGQFIFDQEILIEKGIMSRGSNKGKLAIRVFPPWSEELANESVLESQRMSLKIKKTQRMSDSARKTQKWQLQYFLPFSESGKVDLTLVRASFKKLIH